MIKILYNFMVRIIMTITYSVSWIVAMLIELLWDRKFKRKTAFFISVIMEIWDIKIDDLYIIGKK